MLFLVEALKEKNKRLALSKQLASLARTSLSIQTAASRTLLVTMTPGCPGAAWRGAPLHPRGPEVVNVRSSPRMGCWFRVPPCWGGR